jgi:hypothetical protein
LAPQLSVAVQSATVLLAQRAPDTDGLVAEQAQFEFEAGISDRTSLAQPSGDVTIGAIAEEPARRVTVGQQFHAGAVSGNGVAQDIARDRCECVQPGGLSPPATDRRGRSSGTAHQPDDLAGGHDESLAAPYRMEDADADQSMDGGLRHTEEPCRLSEGQVGASFVRIHEDSPS